MGMEKEAIRNIKIPDLNRSYIEMTTNVTRSVDILVVQMSLLTRGRFQFLGL